MHVQVMALDDERLALEQLKDAIQEAAPEIELRAFRKWREALTEIEENGYRPQIIFMDIGMPGITGLELTKKIKAICPETNIIFVTAFAEYAPDAFSLYPSGYVLKPVTAEKIKTELDNLRYPLYKRNDGALLKVQCFGNFEVYANQVPLHFQRKRTKEFLAYLVSRKGEYCTLGELMTILWPEEPETVGHRNYIRQFSMDLQETLKSINAEEVLLKQRGLWAVRTDLLDCDYYRMLDGDPQAKSMFHGAFMMQYSWAEYTGGLLYRAKV